MIARRLSLAFAVALAVLSYWFMISAPGVVDPEFASTIYVFFALALTAIFGLAFLALRVATAGSQIYWVPGLGSQQVGRIALLIATALAIHLSVSWFFDLQGRFDETAGVVGLIVWTTVPAVFLTCGLVSWPVRLKSASKVRIVALGVASFGIAAAIVYLKFANAPEEYSIPSLNKLLIQPAGLVAAAAAEEVVFRVLLLTALLSLTRSRFNSVFLSSVFFGVTHAPLALMHPVVHADWPMLAYAAQSYLPEFLMQTLFGLFLGVIWLRTGSIVLIVATHAIMNVGPSLLSGF